MHHYSSTATKSPVFTTSFSEPVTSQIKRPIKPKDIPVGDGSPETLTIGDNITSLTNTPLIIKCPANGVPRPVVMWFKDGQPLVTSEGFSTDANDTLSIEGVALSDSGRYTCKAINRGGEDSVTSYVKVIG